MSIKVFLQTATKEQCQQMAQCLSKEEVLSLVQAFGVTLTAEETQEMEEFFAKHPKSELAEAELDQVAGGCEGNAPGVPPCPFPADLVWPWW
ncbi:MULTISPECIES: hypothetical protein [Anoxynatronum]|uniref:Uncharacterized protein n=2 Tax=Anoxynatronum TaxID=210622 RepID=A0AA45WYX4_9CLOT|nr:hypothetical protein [Anoxynatronum buryatiense]SMP71056.1 hypothetical protein SAMN06296020_1224 [Anoxynatronum buryatiense]